MTTLPIMNPTISAERVFEPLGKSGSCLSIGEGSAGSRTHQQITVMLKGLLFDAVVSVDVWTAESSAIGQSIIEMPDSHYNIIADLSSTNNCRSLTLNAISVGNNFGVTLTLTGQSTTQVFQGKSDLGLVPPSQVSYNKTSGTLAEKGHSWVEHSTCNLVKKSAKKNLHGSAGCMVIPSNTVLNLRALVGAFNKLSTKQIETGIQELIDLLDYRNGDPDLEVDVDFEPEIEEEGTQLI